MSWVEDEGLDSYFFDDEDDPTIWITKDSRMIDIQDMEDSHLLNTIAFITKKIGDDFTQHPWHYKQLNMIEEARRRNIYD